MSGILCSIFTWIGHVLQLHEEKYRLIGKGVLEQFYGIIKIKYDAKYKFIVVVVPDVYI